MIRHQPLDYAGVVAGGILHYFEPGHRIGANDYPVGPWQFPADPRVWAYPGYRGPIRAGDAASATGAIRSPSRAASSAGSPARPRSARAPRGSCTTTSAAATRGARCSPPACCSSLAALVTRRGAARLRLDAALLATVVLVCLTVAQALSVFSYRYGFIAAVLLPPAAALAATALHAGRPARAQPPADSTAAAAERPVRTAPSM